MAESSTKFHILLVEDEPVIRELVSSMLSDDTVNVVCAEDGIEGLKLAKTRAFQLILMDVVLPKMDGVTVCRILKSEPTTASVPVYMLTGKANKADVEIATKAGADGYIHKPFRTSDLMDLVERLRSAPMPG